MWQANNQPFSRGTFSDRESGVPRNLVLASLPLILLLASIGGSVAFVAGSGVSRALQSHPHRAILPIAGDRLLSSPDRQFSRVPTFTAIAPVVTRASLPTEQLRSLSTATPGNWVRIPSLGVEVPLALAASMNDADVLQTLSRGVALYPNGIEPGQPGNTFISGHSTGEPWKGVYRFAFLHLNRLESGDTILVDHQGTRYTYRVTGSRTIDPRVVPVLDPTSAKPTLTLMACWPLWTTKNRLLQDAELIAINPLVVASRGAPS